MRVFALVDTTEEMPMIDIKTRRILANHACEEWQTKRKGAKNSE